MALLPPNCLEAGYEQFLLALLARFYGLAGADVADLHLFSHDLSRADRHLSIGDDGLRSLARGLIAFGDIDGAPLIAARLLETDRERLPELPRLRAEGVSAVLVFSLQFGKEHQLGRIVVLSRDPLEEILTGTTAAFLEALAVQMTLAIEAHNRCTEARFLERRWADHGHRLRNHLAILWEGLDRLSRDYPEDKRLRRYTVELEAFGRLPRIFEDPRQYLANLPLSHLAESVIAKTIAAFGAKGRVSWQIEGASVPNLCLRDLEAMAIVLGELTTDSLKYAWPPDAVGTIHVSIEEKEDGGKTWIIVQYEDDGRGLPAGFDLAQSSGTGLRLVGETLKEIGGTFTLGDKPASGQPVHGLTATLRFPR